MKKTCEGCRALESYGANRYGCSLGYAQNIKLRGASKMFTDAIPAEECPKPKTNSKLIFESKMRKNNFKNN